VSYENAEGAIIGGFSSIYDFSGDAHDGSGNGNDGAVHGATLTEDRVGNADSAYYFDGVDDYIDLPIQAFNQETGSISLWFNITEINKQESVLLSMSNNNSNCLNLYYLM